MPAARISVRSGSARSRPPLADQPEGFARELLILRQRGAYASTRKYKKLLEVADPVDHRIRDALRIYGAGPGRWSSVGTGQLQNLARNDRELPASLIDAVIAGDRDALARWGNPLQVVSAISRAALCAAPGQHLVCADFAAIELRVLAWLAGETWKLDAYRQFDKTGNKNIEVYRIVAARMLNKSIEAISTADRQKGKATDLACGYGGSIGALRRIVGDDGRSDEELQADVNLWRTAHPATRKLGRELARAIRVAIRIGQNRPILVAASPQPPLVVAFDGYTLDDDAAERSRNPLSGRAARAQLQVRRRRGRCRVLRQRQAPVEARAGVVRHVP